MCRLSNQKLLNERGKDIKRERERENVCVIRGENKVLFFIIFVQR
jgi:hypothetical protein